jgi:hypothetical protein
VREFAIVAVCLPLLLCSRSCHSCPSALPDEFGLFQHVYSIQGVMSGDGEKWEEVSDKRKDRQKVRNT